MLEKKSDILAIYPELNMSRYKCDNNYQSISWKKGKRSDRQVLSI